MEFTKEKIGAYIKIHRELINDIKLNIGQDSDDFERDTLTAQLVGYVYSNMVEERKLYYYCERPKFFDWLFRRTKQVTFDLKVKDLLLNAPKTDNTERVYIVDDV